MRSIGLIAISLSLALPANGNSFDFLGFHQLVVGSAPTGTTITYTSLPFSDSATATGPSGSEPYGEFSGEQLDPLQLRFTGTLRNGAHTQMQSSGSFTLD